MELEELKKLLNTRDRFCRYNDMQIDVIEPGYAEAVMPLLENKLNGLNVAQGGAIYTLADLAFAAAANSRGPSVIGFTSTISYTRPGSGRFLRAKAKEVSRGRRTCTYDIDVFNDQEKLVAHATMTGFILEDGDPAYRK